MKKEYKMLNYERKGKDGEVLWLTLNNEKMMNAMTDAMQQELLEAFKDIAFDNDIRCVVLTGAGDKAFSSGGDITHFQLELAMMCDFIYASANATFGLLEINLGVLPGAGGTIRLPRKIPINRAKEMIYRAEIIAAGEAYQWGLVNRVLPTPEDLRKEVEKIVMEMMAKPPLALRAAKNIITNSISCESMEAALSIERGNIMWLLSSEDMKEGVASFVEKRKPNFKGK